MKTFLPKKKSQIILFALLIALSTQTSYFAPGTWPPSSHLIAVAHSRGTFDSTFKFDSEAPAHARIQGAYLAEEDTGDTSMIIAQEFETLEDEAPFTLSWIEAISGSHPVIGIPLAYSTERIYDFASSGQTWQSASDEGSIPGGNWNTTIYHFFISHLEVNTLTCGFTIQHSGFVRAVIINDHNYGGFGSQELFGPPSEEDITYSKKVNLQAGMLNIVTIIMNYFSELESFEFVDCSQVTSFDVYLPDSSIALYSEDIVGPSSATMTEMGFPITRQESNSVAIECENGYFLNEGQCDSWCGLNEHIFYTNQCMGEEDLYPSIQLTDAEFDGNEMTLQIYFDFDVSKYPPVVYLPGIAQAITGGLQYLPFTPVDVKLLKPQIWIGEQDQQTDTVEFTLTPFTSTTDIELNFFQKITDTSRQYSILIGTETHFFGTLGEGIGLGNQENSVQVVFFMGCGNSPCDIVLESNGEVFLIIDDYLPKLGSDLGSETRTLRIADDWSSGSEGNYDYHKFMLVFVSPSLINIEVLGDYDIFTAGPVAGSISIDISLLGNTTKIDCSGYSNCAICDANNCLVCDEEDGEDLYLSEDKMSCVNPSSCNLVNNNTFSCVTECEDLNFDVVEQDGYCVLADQAEEDGVSCETGEFYFILIRSCFNCTTGCSSCFGYNKCDACGAGYVLRDVHCLPDYEYSLNLQTSASQYYCQDIEIDSQLLRYNPVTEVTEQLKYGTGYTHSVEITGGVESQNEDIVQIVEDSNARKLVIPSSLLEIGMTLQFSSTYTSTSLKPQISVSSQIITVSVLADLSISIEDSPTIDIKQNEALIVKGYLESGCNREADDLDVSWSQISGDDVEGTESSVTPVWLTFDSCSFEASSTYEYRLTVSDKSGKETKTTDIKIETATELISFDVQILKGSREHVFSQPLTITGNVIYNQVLCPSTAVGEFVFSCEKSGIACQDSDSVFGSKESNSIIIPANYFAESDVIEISISVTISSQTKSKTVTISMKDADIIPIELSCSSAKSCAKYINDGTYTFTASTPTLSSTKGLTYKWTVSESLIQKVEYLNSLKLLKNELTISDDITIEVVVTQSSTSREGRASIVLAPNTPPSGGSISISPTTGNALSTEFTLTASSWTDDDAPLQYLFYYKLPSQSQRVKLGQRQRAKKLTTQLPGGQSASTTITIYVDVFDGLNALASSSTTVIISSSYSSVNILASSVNSLISQYSVLDPYRSLSKLQTASDTIQSQEENFSGEQSKTSINNLVKTKINLLSKLSETPQDLLNDEDSLEMMFETVKSSSYSIKFNNFDSLILARSILDDQLGAQDEDALISSKNSKNLVEALDNLLSYSAEEDCQISNEFSISLKERTQKYLQKISNSNLAEQSPNEDPFIQTTELFDILLIKVTPSEVSQKTLQSQEGTPEISFEVDLDAFEDDLQEFWIQYYVFKNQVFDCSEEDDDDTRRLSEQNNKKGDIGLRFRDKDGNDVKKNIKVKVKNGSQCPDSCDCSDSENYECEDLDIFDVEGQISRIFQASNFSLLKNVSVLLDYPYYKTFVFWGIIVFTLWFGISLAIIHKRLKNYDSLEEFLKSSTKTRRKALVIIMLITHPLLGIYYHINPKIIKPNRVLLYYCRLMLVLAYCAIFGDVEDATQNNYQFKIYLVFIPYITYIPIFYILTLLVENDKKDEHKLSKCLKVKTIIGLFLTLCTVAGCYVIILVITAQKDSDWQKNYAINFAIVVFLDVIFDPISAFFISFLVYGIYRKRKEKMGNLSKKAAEWLIGEEMLKIMAVVRKQGKGATYILSGKSEEEVEKPQTEKDIQAQSKSDEGEDKPPKNEDLPPEIETKDLNMNYAVEKGEEQNADEVTEQKEAIQEPENIEEKLPQEKEGGGLPEPEQPIVHKTEEMNAEKDFNSETLREKIDELQALALQLDEANEANKTLAFRNKFFQ